MKAPLPPNEDARLQALAGYEILDSDPEQTFDDITRLAAFICDTPGALISLVDRDRQWFKSRLGVTPAQLSRDVSFCAHAILEREPLLVPDACADERFSDNPLVTSAPHVRMYAGAPLATPEGHNLGALCVVDTAPRQLTDRQVAALNVLSSLVVAQMEQRREMIRLRRRASEYEAGVQELTDLAWRQRETLKRLSEATRGK